MEYRPKRIKAELFPYEDGDVEAMARCLHDAGMVQIYELNGVSYLKVVNFLKHQHPHINETSRGYPEPDGSTMLAPCSHHTAPLENGNWEQDNGNMSKTAKTKEAKNGTDNGQTYREFIGEGVFPAEWANWCARELGWDQSRIDETHSVFADYWIVGKGRTTKGRDWFARWKQWCRRDHKPSYSSPRGGASVDKAASAVSEVVARRYGNAQAGSGERGGYAAESTDFDGIGIDFGSL